MEVKITRLGIYSMAVGVVSGIAGVLFFAVLDGESYLTDYIPFRGVVIYAWMVLMCVLAIPYLIAGIGLRLLKPWARPFGMVLLTFSLFNPPLGTALGLYGLLALMSPEADEIYRNTSR